MVGQREFMNPAEVRRSLQYDWDGKDRGQLLELSGQYLELGVIGEVLYVRGEQPQRVGEKFAEALPEQRRLQLTPSPHSRAAAAASCASRLGSTQLVPRK